MIMPKVGKKNTVFRIIYVFEYVTIHNRFGLEEITNGNNTLYLLHQMIRAVFKTMN